MGYKERDWGPDFHGSQARSKARTASPAAPDGASRARRFRQVFDPFPAHSRPLGRDQAVQPDRGVRSLYS